MTMHVQTNFVDSLISHYKLTRARLNAGRVTEPVVIRLEPPAPPEPIGCHLIYAQPVGPIIADVQFPRDIIEIATPVTGREIIRAFCRERGIDLVDMLSTRRTRDLLHARHELIYILKTTTKLSLPQIGVIMGGRDHTTILHAVRKHKERMGAA